MLPESRGALRPPTRRGAPRARREAVGRRSFRSSLTALERLAAAGARVAVHVRDLETRTTVAAGDDFVTMPVEGLGTVPLLVEVAARLESGALDALERIPRPAGRAPGLWGRLGAAELTVADAAVLAATTGDQLAANALLDRVGLPAVGDRLDDLGLRRTTVLDRYRADRGLDDAPHAALSTAADMAALLGAIASAEAVSPAVSARVAEWLTFTDDLSLAAGATGLDPRGADRTHGVLLAHATGRGPGLRAEAGALAGPRAAVSYALLLAFDDLSVAHRLRVHDAFRTLGVDLMEYVF